MRSILAALHPTMYRPPTERAGTKLFYRVAQPPPQLRSPSFTPAAPSPMQIRVPTVYRVARHRSYAQGDVNVVDGPSAAVAYRFVTEESLLDDAGAIRMELASARPPVGLSYATPVFDQNGQPIDTATALAAVAGGGAVLDMLQRALLDPADAAAIAADEGDTRVPRSGNTRRVQADVLQRVNALGAAVGQTDAGVAGVDAALQGVDAALQARIDQLAASIAAGAADAERQYAALQQTVAVSNDSLAQLVARALERVPEDGDTSFEAALGRLIAENGLGGELIDKDTYNTAVYPINAFLERFPADGGSRSVPVLDWRGNPARIGKDGREGMRSDLSAKRGLLNLRLRRIMPVPPE